jgi:hypothetical protein
MLKEYGISIEEKMRHLADFWQYSTPPPRQRAAIHLICPKVISLASYDIHKNAHWSIL